jgi:hypothetical protein
MNKLPTLPISVIARSTGMDADINSARLLAAMEDTPYGR